MVNWPSAYSYICILFNQYTKIHFFIDHNARALVIVVSSLTMYRFINSRVWQKCSSDNCANSFSNSNIYCSKINTYEFGILNFHVYLRVY